MHSIFLDNMSTTPLDPLVISSMNQCLNNLFGNPSSIEHKYGWEANEAIEKSRENIAKLLNCQSIELIFTSGATESINLALLGSLLPFDIKKNHIITVKTEHEAALHVFKFLSTKGYKIDYLNPNNKGLIDLNILNSKISEKTKLISIMHVNNEIGVIQPIFEIGNLCYEKDIIFHVDAAQSIGKISCDLSKLKIDLLSFSGHKIYGPKGIGTLYINSNKNINLKPIMHGGKQENSIRPGTLSVHNIVGLGKACEIANKKINSDFKKIISLQRRLLNILYELPKEISFNGCLENRIPGNLNFNIDKINGKTLMMKIPNIAFSSGSACSSGLGKGSHVIKALKKNNNDSKTAIRIGIGRFNTKKDIDIFGNELLKLI